MNDYQQILERARKWRSDKCLRYNLSAARRHDAEAYHILTQLLAAIDAAQGETVAWQVNAFGVCQKIVRREDVADELADSYRRSGYENVEIVPLYAAPPAAVPAGWVIQRSATREGKICIVAPDCNPGGMHITYGGVLEKRLLCRLCEAMPAAGRDETPIDVGGESVPRWVVDYADALTTYHAERGGGSWAIGGVQSREHAPPEAVPDWLPQPSEVEHVGDAGPATDADFVDTPAAVPANVRERWNIERDEGGGLLVCFNNHDKGEACEYVRYVPEAPPAAVPAADPMSLAVALDFADNPRPHHSLACPADTNGDLYRALAVLAKAYREAKPAAVPAGYVPASMLVEAREEVESWAAYATPYFQDKHDLAGVLAKIDGQIAAATPAPPAAVPARSELRFYQLSFTPPRWSTWMEDTNAEEWAEQMRANGWQVEVRHLYDRPQAPPAATVIDRISDERLRAIHREEQFGLFCDYEEFVSIARHLEALLTRQAPPAALAVPAGWREHVEDRIRTWRQSFVNRHGDQLEILDFMGSDSLDDLIDYVCSGQVQPAALAVPEAAALVQKWREQANAALRRSGTWNGNDMADRIERMADELAAILAANKENGND